MFNPKFNPSKNEKGTNSLNNNKFSKNDRVIDSQKSGDTNAQKVTTELDKLNIDSDIFEMEPIEDEGNIDLDYHESIKSQHKDSMSEKIKENKERPMDFEANQKNFGDMFISEKKLNESNLSNEVVIKSRQYDELSKKLDIITNKMLGFEEIINQRFNVIEIQTDSLFDELSEKILGTKRKQVNRPSNFKQISIICLMLFGAHYIKYIPSA